QQAQDAQRKMDQQKAEAEARARQEAQANQQAQQRPILDALTRFNDAFASRKPAELQQIWPGASGAILDAIKRNPQVYTLVITLTPKGAARINGDTATIACEQLQQVTVNRSPQPEKRKPVTVTLHRAGDQWKIVEPFGAAQ